MAFLVKIKTKGSISKGGRQNLLLSATLNGKVNRLAKISLNNPVMIGLDDQKKPSGKFNIMDDNHTCLLSDEEEDEILEKQNCLVEHAVDDFKLPAHLHNWFKDMLKFYAVRGLQSLQFSNLYLKDKSLRRLLFSCQLATLKIFTIQYSASLSGALAHNLIWIRRKTFFVVKCSVCMVIWSRMIARNHFWVSVLRNLQFLYLPILLLGAWTFQKSSTSYSMILQGKLPNMFTGLEELQGLVKMGRLSSFCNLLNLST